jgi:heme exporter protein B
MSSIPSLSSAFWQTFRRDCVLVMRKRMDVLNPLVFGFLVALTFPLGLGPAPQTLSALAPGLIWVIALLSCLLATDGLFQEDFEDGSLTLMLLSPQSSYFLVMARLWAHWLKSGFAVSLIAPLLGLMLYLPASANGVLLAALLLGTISLVFLGGIGAALTVGLKNSGVLLTLIILPLYVPVLIFGSAAVQAAAEGMAAMPYVALLGAFACLSVTLAPLATQAALKINLDAA